MYVYMNRLPRELEIGTWQKIVSLSRDNKKEKRRKSALMENLLTGLLVGEWPHPFCSWPRVGRLMGPKPMASEDQTGFSPDDQNNFFKL